MARPTLTTITPAVTARIASFLPQEDLGQLSCTCKSLHPLLYKNPRISTERQAALFLEVLEDRPELARLVENISFWATRDIPDELDTLCRSNKVYEDHEDAEWSELEGEEFVFT